LEPSSATSSSLESPKSGDGLPLLIIGHLLYNIKAVLSLNCSFCDVLHEVKLLLNTWDCAWCKRQFQAGNGLDG
jgi:hypothetical protein